MSDKSSKIHEQAHGYEFGGPIGAAVISIGLPTFTYFMLFACNDISGCPAPFLLHPSTLSWDSFLRDIGWYGWDMVSNWKTFLVTLCYYALSLLLYKILPAVEVEGTELRNGSRIRYRFNIWNTCWVILVVLASGTTVYGANFVVWTFIEENYIAFLTSNIVIALGLSIFAYVNSFSIRSGHPTKLVQRELALGGVSGNILYDWFIGRELNPPLWIPGVGYIDIKSWMEVRPGMMGWLIFNLAFVVKQFRNHGRITDSMLLVVITQAIYILDAFWNEPSIMTQIDITTDGFGFMLAFGDLIWVPFIFSLQARYLSVYPYDLGPFGVLAIVAVYLLGYYIFRASNTQKDIFRTKPKDPSVEQLPFIQTKTGSRLLTGGWWGAARHINYLGDWMLSCAYCLPTGIAGYVIQGSYLFSSNTKLGSSAGEAGREVVPGEAWGWGMLVTYFYLIYFAVLLVHRQRRDDAKCRRKYGDDWDKYVKQVPSRIIPGIY